jgi:hypothetical protein
MARPGYTNKESNPLDGLRIVVCRDCSLCNEFLETHHFNLCSVTRDKWLRQTITKAGGWRHTCRAGRSLHKLAEKERANG